MKTEIIYLGFMVLMTIIIFLLIIYRTIKTNKELEELQRLKALSLQQDKILEDLNSLRTEVNKECGHS